MNILDIAIAKKLAGGGGGSGTDNYNDLSNLPKINDVTLSGNKSSSALGLQSEITSENKLDSDLIDDTDQDNKFVTSSEKNMWNAKQNAIDADHKLNADYVDDSTSTNKFVTASDKEAWNAKQNAIDNSHKLSSDLVDDANHTNKFVTSTEKNTWNGKQNAIDSEHKLSSSLVSFTTAEAAALASGIDSTKVAQISTNQSNILYALRKVGTNMFNFEAWANKVAVTNSGTKSVSENTITISATTNSDTYTDYSANEYPVDARIPVNAGDKLYMSWDYSSADNVTGNVYIFGNASTSSMANADATAGHLEYTVPASGISYISMRVGLGTNQSGKSGTWSNIQIIMKSAYDSGVTDFEPFALPNYDLTRLQAEDRAALAEVVDSGAKNVLDWANTIVSNNNATGTKTDTSLTVASASTIYGNCSFGTPKFEKASRVVFSFSVSAVTTASGSRTMVQIYSTGGASGNPITDVQITGTGKYSLEFDVPANTSYYVFIYPSRDTVKSGNTITITDLMICTKAAFGVSNKFVPYRPNYDLVCNSVIDLNDMISSFTVNSSKSVSIKLRRDSSFTMLMFGFVQTIGKVHWYIESNTSTSVSVIDAMTGLAVSQSVISFAYSESTAVLTISANVSGNCNFVLIRSAY